MPIKKVTEINSASKIGFQDAIDRAFAQANRTLDHIEGAWIDSQKMVVEGRSIREYHVVLKVALVVED